MRLFGGGLRVRGFLVISGFFLFFLVSVGLSFFVPAVFGFGWKGYYTVLLDGGADIAAVSASLEQRGFRGFLSLSTARVEISDFDRLESVLLRDVPVRLLAEDPRMDAFLRGAPFLFRSGSGKEHIIYFPVRESPVTLALRLGEVFEGFSWSLVDWHTGRRFALLCVFFLVTAFFMYFNPGIRFFVCVFAFPWLGFFVHGDLGVFAGGVLLYSAAVFFLERAVPRFEYALYYGYGGGGFWDGELRSRLFLGCVLALSAFLLAFFSGGGFAACVPLLLGLLGSFFLGACVVFCTRHKKARREHRLFIPLSILTPSWGRGSSVRPFIPVVLLCALLVSPLVFRLSGGGGSEGESVPRPRSALGGGGFSFDALRELWLGGGDARLPDFSDYICHRAFQRGFFYGYSGDFPSLGAVVSLPRFSEDGGGVRRQEETLLIYDEIWYKEELQKAMEPGLGNLLSHQGAVGIGFEPIRRVSFDAFWFFRYGLIVAFGLSPLVFAGAGRAFRLVRFVKNSEFRRKQQEA